MSDIGPGEPGRAPALMGESPAAVSRRRLLAWSGAVAGGSFSGPDVGKDGYPVKPTLK